MNILKAKVGEQLKMGLLLRPVYAGLPNKTTFSVVFQNLGNLYFPITINSITIFSKKFKVIKVDESEIQLEEVLVIK